MSVIIKKRALTRDEINGETNVTYRIPRSWLRAYASPNDQIVVAAEARKITINLEPMSKGVKRNDRGKQRPRRRQ